MSTFGSDVLQHLKRKHGYSTEQLADAGNVHVSSMFKFASGERELPFDVARTLSRHFERVHNDTAFADEMHTPAYCSLLRSTVAEVNGSVDDELADLVEASAALRKAHRDGDADAYHAANRQIEEIQCRIRKEGDVI